ncbi:FAD-dependent monooxygenase [Hamadaea sp. NPDC050747]|uniref:FAD-dependent monooxygenase n=1 Tax=Hamadaea sp. NPDC050747 TaxID=3155789 RepID=UPI00340C1C33
MAAVEHAMNTPRLLVVGAGPTGLALALQAAVLGAQVRLIDRRANAARPSRAMLLHSRTLEVLRPLGLADALIERAITAPRMQLHVNQRTVPVTLADFAVDDTAYPHLSLIRQAAVETVLTETLAQHGVSVEWGVELSGFTASTQSGVRAYLHGARYRSTEQDFLAGCDGAASTVRRAAHISAPGRAYRQEVVLADVELDDDLTPEAAHVAAGWDGLVFLFPIGERAPWRILATRQATSEGGDCIGMDDVQRILDLAHLPTKVAGVAWSSVVPLRRQLAQCYRRGSVFLAGDAAHTHSPAGGQGMNTGIHDAINLGWKLALAGSSTARDTLLDSYEVERRPVARTIMALTDVVFWAEAGTDPVASLARTAAARLGAPLLPGVLGWRRLVAEGFRTLAQLRTGYPRSPLSIDDRPPSSMPVGAGGRLPDMPVVVSSGPARLHELTAEPGTHLLLLRDAAEPGLMENDRIRVHRLLDRPGAGLIGVRPDGYVGLRAGRTSSPSVKRWLRLTGALSGPTP